MTHIHWVPRQNKLELPNDEEEIKYGNIVLTTTTGHRVWYHLCLLFLVRLGGYIVNLSDFYSYRFIGKLTAFLQLQEFILRNSPVTSSTSVTCLSLNNSRAKVFFDLTSILLSLSLVSSIHNKHLPPRPIKTHYQAFFGVLIDLIVDLLDLIIKSFHNQTET
jgi:hypothetical protein